MITIIRIVRTLSWMVENYRWRADETRLNVDENMRGGYSPELQEGINLLTDLTKAKNALYVNLDCVPKFKSEEVSAETIIKALEETLKNL